MDAALGSPHHGLGGSQGGTRHLVVPGERAELEQSVRNPLRRLWLRILARLLEWLTDLQPKQLNYTDVTPQLAVGGAFRKRQIKRLRERHVTAVVDCRKEASDDAASLATNGIEFLHVPTVDRHGFTYAQMEHAVNWVLDRIQNGGKAFLHCEHGVGRGPLMTCAVLVAQGHSAPEALRIVRAKRWQAMPNDRQLAALLEFERGWRARSSSAMHDAAALDDGLNRLGRAQPANVGNDITPA